MTTEVKLPNDIISFYSKYKNSVSQFKVSTINGTNTFQIDDNYEIIDSIGQGAYGVVVAAKDKNSDDQENNLVAIKKIEKAFEHKIFTRRTLRQLKLLRLLQHENVLNITQILLPKAREKFEDIYLVSELMETDLASIIKSEQPLSDDHCQFFLYQILRGLQYIHSAKVVHRDLKPRNLLVNSNCDLKIADFGLARSLVNVQIKANIMTDYVATRWYRAPELLLSWKEYNEAVDVWSVGCIFAELLRRKPFLPGTDTQNQLELIFEIIGTPSEEEINSIPKEKYKQIVKSMPKRAGKPLERLFPNASAQAIELLKSFLTFDPQKRITVEQALNHPYLSELHFPDDEPTRDPVSKIEFEFEDHTLTLQQLKDLIYQEILLYHYPEFQTEYEKKKKNGQSVISHIIKNSNANLQDPDSSEGQSSSDE